jgi:ABC-type transport system involved in multi-copper enzyme maturation permease subunit
VISQAILHLELLLGARRSRQYIFRYIYGGWLVAQFLALYSVYRLQALTAAFQGTSYPPGVAALDYLQIFLTQQYLLIFLVTPALVAGAVTDEKERGTLQLLYSAGMTSAEIALGKWLGRSVMVANILVAGVPFLLGVGSFADMNSGWLLLILVQLIATIAGVAALSLLASVWSRHTRDAVLSLYAIGGCVWLLLRAVPSGGPTTNIWFLGLLRFLDPVFIWECAWSGGSAGEVAARLGVYLAWWTLMGGGALVLAVARMRPAYMRQLTGISKRPSRIFGSARPPVTDDPIHWKEANIVGLAPLLVLRSIPTWASLALTTFVSVGCTYFILLMSIDSPNWRELIIERLVVLGLGGLVVATLVVGIRCSGAITAEREKQTWEALLLSPLGTEELVRSKLWGVIRATYPYLGIFAFPPLLLACAASPWAVLAWLGMVAVMFLAMYYSGAAGLWCSARSKNSWRSLLALLGWVYLGGFLVYGIVGTVIVPIVFFVLFVALEVMLAAVGGASMGPRALYFGYALWFPAVAIFFLAGFWYGAQLFLRGAVRHLADYDRARHWGQSWTRERHRIDGQAFPRMRIQP